MPASFGDGRYVVERFLGEGGKKLVEQWKAGSNRSMADASAMDPSMQRLVKAVRLEGDTYGRMTVEWNQSRATAMVEKHAYMIAAMAAIGCVLFGQLGYWFGRSRP